MDDKRSNILASLMVQQNNKPTTRQMQQATTGCQPKNRLLEEQKENTRPISGLSGSGRSDSAASGRTTRPGSGSNSRHNQHKLKQRFTVIKKLGKGTYGKVQLAINKETQQEVAIKTIKKTKIENEQDLERVRREIQIMSSIEHPHIIHIYEVFENKDKIVLVMQYAPGGELYEYVNQLKGLNDQEARRIFRQIATAIFYCHQNKICHRDLKLENILLDEKNNAKLADFGLSNVFDKQRQLKTFCGSPLYASPEIVQGSPYEGPEVDCWSLGVLLYTLVYGAMPFDGSNFKRLVKQISEACYFEPKQRSQASPLIRSLLCADPNKRATILDICSDPWVNGISPLGELLSPLIETSPPPSSQEDDTTTNGNATTTNTTNQKHYHTPLLKVAQDMANLTPVRLDILLALVPPTSATFVGPPEVNNKQVEDETRQQSIKKSARRSSVVLDPSSSIMEVDEVIPASSPVASFVVRDLSPEQNHQIEEEQNQSVEPMVEMESCDMQVEEVEPPEVNLPEEETPVVSDQKDKAKDGEGSESRCILEDISHVEEPTEEESKVHQDALLEKETEGLDAVASQEVNMETDTDIDANVAIISGDPVQSEENLVIENSKMEESRGQEAKPMPDEQEHKQLEHKQPEVSSEEKPKKIKKKVIVVKKRKKVGSRADVGDEDKQKTETGGGDEKTPVKKTLKSSKGPGKVKIPESFKTKPEAVDNSEKLLEQAGSRRQSALIADVSQKLLQQLQQNNQTDANNSAIKSDQTQLTGVRVSDKKEEFERRASLMSSPTSGPTQSKGSQRERELEETIRELLTVMAPDAQASTAIIEPVRRLSVQETSELIREITSSISSKLAQQQSNELTLDEKADVERRLSESMKDFEFACADNNQLVPNIRDDRSDSVETIKADLTTPSGSPQNFADKKVKSTFSINLSGQPVKVSSQQVVQNNGVDSTGSATSSSLNSSVSGGGGGGGQQAMLPQGPAPMTRSYKKVTFTKDGACITETGKIYSTQADDGTIRRIERKSKITHYPATSEKSTVGNQMIEKEEEEEEIVYEEPGQFQKLSSGGRHGKFDKLIMPSSEFSFGNRKSSGGLFQHGELKDQHQSFGRRSPFGRERADSASSCSSNSTDVFDDIFDQWTGAISMFDQHKAIFDNRGAELGMGSLFSRPQAKQHFKRLGRMNSSLAGSPRCGSADPKMATSSGKPTAGRSGYESDSNQETFLPRRPASGLGSARGDFGSSHFGFGAARMADEGFLWADRVDDDPFLSFHSEAMRRHEKSIRQRLKQQQRQLWKGSTPSLFDDEPSWGRTTNNNRAFEPEPGTYRQPLPREGSSGPAGQRQQMRPQASDSMRCGDTSGGKPLEQSHSSGGSVHGTPLQASPIRERKTTVASFTLGAPSMLPPKMATSTSRSSVKQDASLTGHQVASFIEINRTSSSLNTSLKQANEQMLTRTSSRVVSQSGSTSGLLLNRHTPSPISNIEQDSMSFPESAGAEQFLSKQENDSRIQSWLQNSVGNLSGGSSGFKSSASDATTNYSPAKEPSMSNVQIGSKAPASALLPPTGNKRTVSSSAVIELAGPTSGSNQRTEASIQRDMTIDSLINNNEDTRSQVSRATTSSSSRLSSNNKAFSVMEQQQQQQQQQTVLSSRQEHHQQQVISMTRSSSRSSGARTLAFSIVPGSAPIQSGSKLDWITNSDPNSILIGPFDEMSLCSGSGSSPNDRDLDASSSLLDQLRSRGYKSMISQRIISSSKSSNQQQLQQSRPIVDLSGSTSESSSMAAVVDGNTKSGELEVSSSLNELASRQQRVVQTGSGLSQEKQTKFVKIVKKSSNSDKNDDESLAASRAEELNPPEVGSIIIDNNMKSSEIVVESMERPASGGNVIQEKEKEEEEEEEDEDIREAKASIKSHLDRAKETELFLKSMQKEEEEFDRQRQQLFLFNNLMLSSKLQGLCQRDLKIGTEYNSQAASSGAQSAPVRSNNPLGGLYNSLLKTSNNINLQQTTLSSTTTTTTLANFHPSAALSFEPTFTLTNNAHLNTSIYHDPLEPVEPLYLSSLSLNSKKFSSYNDGSEENYTTGSTIDHRRGRSRSQIRDFGQFEETRRISRLPARGCLNNHFSSGTEPIRGRRSLSQIRYPPGNSYAASTTTRPTTSTMMSEYRSAYGGSSTGNNTFAQEDIDSCSPIILGSSGFDSVSSKRLSNNPVDCEEDSDDGMSAYRASSYVPKVVPQGMPTERLGRRAYRRTESCKQEVVGSPSSEGDEGEIERLNWRKSFDFTSSSSFDKKNQDSLARAVSPTQTTADTTAAERRSSLSTSRQSLSNSSFGENSRLSELEQRIQENKKRREELLASNSSINTSPKLTRRRFSRELDEEVDLLNRTLSSSSCRETNNTDPKSKTNQTTSTNTTKLVSRPSRLESMEARIKRRSYCVRLGDYSPERSLSNKNSSPKC